MAAPIVPATLNQFADLVDESIQKLFIKAGKEDNPIYDKFMYVSRTNSYYTKDSSISGFRQASRITENASVLYDAPVQNYNKTYTQKKYGVGAKLSDFVWKFGIDFRKLQQLPNFLMQSCIWKREVDAADMLNNSFATSYTDADGQSVTTSGGDSVAAISASHTNEAGGTNWNNRVTDGTTVNMDFEYDALKYVHQVGAAVTGPRGEQINVSPDTLLCKKGSSVQFRAEEILGALKRNMIPGSDDNDGSASVAFKIVIDPYLTNDAYYWFLDSSKLNSDFGYQWIWSQEPKLDPADLNYDTDEYKRKATMFYDRGINDARFVLGSKGTNAA